MKNTLNHSPGDHSERSHGPSARAFRKVKWIKRKRGLVAFFTFLAVVAFILFFDYYYVLISRIIQRPSNVAEQAAGKYLKVSVAERQNALERTKKLLDAGQVEEARKAILAYLQRESNAEGNYLAGLVYMRQGDVGSAFRYFKEATRLQGDFYEAKQKLAEIYLIVGDLKSAQQTADILTKQSNYLEDGLLLQSDIALAEGKLDEALKKVSEAVDQSKGASRERASIYLANLLVRKGERARAEQIISRIDVKRLRAAELLALFRYYEMIGQRERASAVLKDGLARHPDSPELHYYFGQNAFSKNRYEDAISHFQKVYKAMPNSRIASYRVGQSLLASGHLKEAKDHIDAALNRYPQDILALSLKTRYELLTNQMNGAIKTLKQTVNIVPGAPRPHTLLAELYWNQGIMSVAEAYAQKALKLGENTNSPRIVLGDIYTRKGQHGKAIEQYGKILEREPTNLIALVQSADNYLNQGEVKKAEAFYEKVLIQYPDIQMIRTKLEMVRNLRNGPKEILNSAYRYYQKAPDAFQAVNGYIRALILNNRNDEAAGILKSAMKKEPGNVQYPVMLGDLYLLKRNVSAAKELFEQALKMAPKDLNVLINIGSRYEKNSLDKEAELLYLRAVELYPDNMIAVNHVAWFYSEKGVYAKARPFVDTLRVKGEGAYEKDTVGWFFYKTGDYSSAESYLREALQLDPDNNAIRGHLALALFQTGKSKDALVEAEKVVPVLPPGDLKEKLSSLLVLKKKGTSSNEKN